MRITGAGVIIIFMIFSGIAIGSSPKKDAESTVLAREVQAKVVRKSNEVVRVRSEGCQLAVDFSTHNVIFQVPLRGTHVEGTEKGDGVVITNKAMTRKLSGKNAEPYEHLILLFDRAEVDHMVTLFQQAIKACGT